MRPKAHIFLHPHPPPQTGFSWKVGLGLPWTHPCPAPDQPFPWDKTNHRIPMGRSSVLSTNQSPGLGTAGLFLYAPASIPLGKQHNRVGTCASLDCNQAPEGAQECPLHPSHRLSRMETRLPARTTSFPPHPVTVAPGTAFTHVVAALGRCGRAGALSEPWV